MFIWTIGDIIGASVIGLLVLGFVILYLVSYIVDLFERAKKKFKG